jgi:Pyridoxamine 5'-phosphate oxidase
LLSDAPTIAPLASATEEKSSMHETSDDLKQLQQLLDGSYESAGRHFKAVTTPDRRIDAVTLVERLEGMCLLVLATVTADGRPICGPVDGIFFRGAFHFGSAPDSVRFGHIAQRPQVSATHLPGEELAVTVHGQAVPIDVARREHGQFRQTLLDIYTARYGPEWEEFLNAGPVYARIDATRMFTFAMPAE